jgi:hypothetical protein
MDETQLFWHTFCNCSVPCSGGLRGEIAEGDSRRHTHAYALRTGADDISFSFIPSGDSMDRFVSFFPACTSTPNMDCSFDPETRKFTIRFYNTALESGGITDTQIAQWSGAGSPYLGLYPIPFPRTAGAWATGSSRTPPSPGTGRIPC